MSELSLLSDSHLQIFEQKSFDTIKTELLDHAEAIGLVLDENNSGIVTKMTEVYAYREFLLRQRFEQDAKQCFLISATGSALDVFGVQYNTPRQIIQVEDLENDLPQILEEDARYKERLLLAVEAITNAGTAEAYLYHTKKANVHILDAKVVSPTEAVCHIYLRTDNDDLTANAAIRLNVAEYLHQDHIKPIGDQVIVSLSEAVNIDFQAQIYARTNPIDQMVLNNKTLALQDYFNRIEQRLGVTVSLSAIYDALHDDGIRKIVVQSPADNIELLPHQYPVINNFNIEVIYE